MIADMRNGTLVACLAAILAASTDVAFAQRSSADILRVQATPEAATDQTPPASQTPVATEAAPVPAEPWFLMKSLKGTWVGEGLQSWGTSIYGWLEQGFGGNPASPSDRVNFGANLDWRSNDYRFNQFYLVAERPFERENTWGFGYRLDFLIGTDAPWFVANGLFSGFTGYEPTSGIGVDGPKSFRQVNAIGIDLPQFYSEIHIPQFLTPGGIDIRIGKFYSLMGRDVYPAADTDFYSRTYENILATPVTNTGGLITLHATPALDIVAGVVVGWDVFIDNNSMTSFTGSFVWNSPDKRYNWTTSWITGPEQPDNNRYYRTLVTSYLTAKLDGAGDWVLSTGGHFAHEANAAVDPDTGQRKNADWYGYTVNLFYTLDPRLRFGGRFEWFRDADGTRTAVLGRPGFRANFFETTLGVTYAPWRPVIIRPELRVDWSPDARPYNDQIKKVQFVPAFDVIVRF
jgi:putative OmpL-like beta-barrel porin-2